MTDMDCRTETVTIRPRHGKPVKFTRRVGRDCPKRRTPSTRHLRPYQYESKVTKERRANDPRLNGAACSHTSRVVRGGLGALIGGVIGGMVGGGLAVAAATLQADVTAPVETVSRFKHWALIGSGIAIVGAVGGLAVGAAKPEC